MSDKSILIIKPDHIGDYVIVRNLIRAVKQSKKYQDYKFFLLLNKRLQKFADFLDSDIVEKIFYIELDQYIVGDWYYDKKNYEITQFSYTVVVNAMFARFLKLEEFIVSFSNADKILFSDGLQDSKALSIRNAFDLYYTNIVELSDMKIFEFDKFKYAFEKLLNEKIHVDNSKIELNDCWQLEVSFDFDYIVICIGADAEYRKWSIYKYIKLIKYILYMTDLHVILCGGFGELAEASEVENHIDDLRLINLVGKTSLLDILAIVSKSKIVISNETGVAHISIALAIPTLVISNANHFGKFTPYPNTHTNCYFVVYPFDFNESDFNEYKKLYYENSSLNIDEISVKRVVVKLDKIFHLLQIKVNKLSMNYQEILKDPLIYLGPTQLSINYEFSGMYSILYTKILELKNSKKKFVLYGNGSFGQTLVKLLENSIVAVVDSASNIIAKEFEVGIIYAPENLKNILFDCVIITLLGRENEIEEKLVNKFNIASNQIIKFKITKGRYNVRTK